VIPGNTDTEKMTGTTAVSNSTLIISLLSLISVTIPPGTVDGQAGIVDGQKVD
jgi:hypothetical protein